MGKQHQAIENMIKNNLRLKNDETYNKIIGLISNIDHTFEIINDFTSDMNKMKNIFLKQKFFFTKNIRKTKFRYSFIE